MKWISIDKEKPHPFIAVLLYCRSGFYEDSPVLIRQGFHRTEGFKNHNDKWVEFDAWYLGNLKDNNASRLNDKDDAYNYVTHWMYLPEAPNERIKNEQ